MATVDEALGALDELVDVIQDERDRLAVEREALLAAKAGVCVLIPPLCFLDVGELQTRADALATMIAALEESVSRAAGIEAKFRKTGNATDLSRALQLFASIADVAVETSAVDELVADVVLSAREIVADLRKIPQLAPKLGLGIGLVLAGAAALLLVVKS